MSDESRHPTEFGPNVWLIDEMYRQFVERPESVSESWREFFSDYRPAVGRPAAVPPGGAPRPAMEGVTAAAAAVAPPPTEVPAGAVPLVGPAGRLVENMEGSLAVPTATSVRTIPVKLLEENRLLANLHLAEGSGGKLSFTHILAWAVVQALRRMPALRTVYLEVGGRPYKLVPEHVNLGLAVDLERKDGSRALLVPNIKNADTLDFAGFFAAYNALLRRVFSNQLSPDDFAGTTVSLTNPGMLGTSQSVPRLMPAQSCIVAVGSIDYPPEYRAADPKALAALGISRVTTLTCTYDHRVIQGAESGLFLGELERLLAGGDQFYEGIFASLKIPHEPFRAARDTNPYLGDGAGRGIVEKQAAVLQLIHMHRVRGHLVAHINPLNDEIPTHEELELSRYGLTIWDLDREFLTGGLGGRDRATLREILVALREAYCGTLSAEFMHIQDPEQRVWLQERLERSETRALPRQAKLRILDRLNAAEAFERFLHTKYVGHKRFSLEGAETLIPLLDRLLQRAARSGVEAVVMGMSHRGRLNVLANVLGKSAAKIFREFEGDIDPMSREGTGDVKYHLGAEADWEGPEGERLHITLASNPSHLEAVDPVVEGMARAAQDTRGDTARRRVLPVLVHGDAAFAGQGVVAETLNLSALPGYRTGGTIHVVVNNGIGFTTAPADARSSVYATDVARMVQAPIFHVNAEDPEACAFVIELAFEFRQAFAKDVVVDLIGYRRWGHNEADEPAFTQPLMYAKIRDRRSVRKLYTETLVNRGELDLAEAEALLDDFRAKLEATFEATRESAPPGICPLPLEPPLPPEPPPPPPAPLATLEMVSERLARLPEGFAVHPKLQRLLESRREALAKNAVDFGTAEALAFALLLLEGKTIRLAGQDSRRGTFSHRHAVLVDQITGTEYTPLQHVAQGQPPFLIYDSPLSEYAALGFEYGYSVQRPDALVLWEAQFGDFANGAQIVIDQFIAAAHEKWDQHARLTLLLPHGFEGQGPEHSSARMERFLQLAAGENMRIAVPSTAGQYFHLLRSQAHMDHAVPLVVFTPKSLLRAETARASGQELVAGHWQPLLPDPSPPPQPTTLLLCTGKVAYDLLARRADSGDGNTTIVRVEQLHPFPLPRLIELLAAHPTVERLRWVQEEPRNMGAWGYLAPLLAEAAGGRPLAYVGRPAAGSPATGSARIHQSEQEWLVNEAFRQG
ncbi:MAG: multifunctional oxoglutarate decarboxylase/oxoglutarate dehydrogenase thiamine pyrophosphate-binding subunit/dihydrolipoyllysine-residue succinyltransferase subunit [Thermoanaerobaculaceae bacterium]|nr:multifunctional oxoglutarate decarboxylase/oxoglutarate dehydrogenase thiamine pyrophosphate-binding subunit/dihydrolipoyllysine-residue succinyltransferase subunit [Thermoanaerobaculaceae bacterium]